MLTNFRKTSVGPLDFDAIFPGMRKLKLNVFTTVGDRVGPHGLTTDIAGPGRIFFTHEPLRVRVSP